MACAEDVVAQIEGVNVKFRRAFDERQGRI